MDEKNIEKIKEDNKIKWSTYEANAQAYRGIFLSSQSLLLAVGAITLERNIHVITIIIAVISLIQIWVVWRKVIFDKTKIIDFYKFDMNIHFTSKGKLKEKPDLLDPLEEPMYEYDIMEIVNNKMTEHPDWIRINTKNFKFKTRRKTRFQLDIIIPATITFIWAIFIGYSVITMLCPSIIS